MILTWYNNFTFVVLLEGTLEGRNYNSGHQEILRRIKVAATFSTKQRVIMDLAFYEVYNKCTITHFLAHQLSANASRYDKVQKCDLFLHAHQRINELLFLFKENMTFLQMLAYLFYQALGRRPSPHFLIPTAMSQT